MLWISLLIACGPSAAPPTDATVLAAADAHDGTIDHVVSECTGCGLGMAGTAEHTVEKDGYTLQFCSDRCKMGFEENPEEGLQTLGRATGTR